MILLAEILINEYFRISLKFMIFENFTKMSNLELSALWAEITKVSEIDFVFLIWCNLFLLYVNVNKGWAQSTN